MRLFWCADIPLEDLLRSWDLHSSYFLALTRPTLVKLARSHHELPLRSSRQVTRRQFP